MPAARVARVRVIVSYLTVDEVRDALRRGDACVAYDASCASPVEALISR